MIYEVHALTVWVGDAFYESWDYKKIGYASEEEAKKLRLVVVDASKKSPWPLCDMVGWPLFRLFPVTLQSATELRAIAEGNVARHLRGLGD